MANAANGRPGPQGPIRPHGGEVIFGRSPMLRFFISSRMADRSLDEERRVAAVTLSQLGYALPWWWEEHGVASPLPAEDICVENARASDGLILILADRLTHVTRREYETARDAGVPCFIFLKQGVRRSRQAESFVRTERRRVTTATFSTPGELATAIVNALRQHTVVSWRLSILTGPPASWRELGEGTMSQPANETVTRGDPSQIEKFLDELSAEIQKEDPTEVARALVFLADQGLESGSAQRVEQVLDRLLPVIDTSSFDSGERAWLENIKGRVHSALGRTEAARNSYERMCDLARDAGDQLALGTALQNLGVTALQLGDPDEAEDFADQALRELEPAGELYSVLQLRLNVANIALERQDLARVERLLFEVEPLAREHGFHHLVSAINGTRGVVASQRGELGLAERLLKRSLYSARRRQHGSDEIIALQNLGAACAHNGQPLRALRWYGRAIAVGESMGSTPRLAVLHRSRASVLCDLERLNDAAEHFKAAASVAESIGDELGAATARADLAAVNLSLGDPQAERDLANVLADLLLFGDRPWQGRALSNLAVAKQEADPETARHLLELALVASPDTETTIEWHHRAAWLYLQGSERLDKANEHLDAALELQANNLDPGQLAWEHARAAALMMESGYEAQAMSYYDRALEIARESRVPEAEFHLMNDRGILLEEIGRGEEAIEEFRRCLKIARSRRDRVMEQQARYNLGETSRRLGRPDVALRETKKAVQLARSLEDPRRLAEALANLGSVYVSANDPRRADQALEEALRLARVSGLDSVAARALAGKGNVAFLRSDHGSAVRLYEESADGFKRIEDWAQYVSTLGAALETKAVIKDLAEEAIQHLVDEAQQVGQDEAASAPLARIGRILLQDGKEDEAAHLWALSIILPGVGAHRSSRGSERIGEEMTKAALLVAAYLENESPKPAEDIYKKLETRLTDDFDVPASLSHSIVTTAREVMRDRAAAYPATPD